VWDYKPSAEKLASESGWREAVEIMPDLVDNREIMTTHRSTLTSSLRRLFGPSASLRLTSARTVCESQAKAAFKTVVDAEVAKETDQYPETQYDAAVVDAARIVFEARMDEIASATTHEAVDAL
jgi:hypothetical protein